MSSKNVLGAKNGRDQVTLYLRRSKQWIGSVHGAVKVGFIDAHLWPGVSVCKVSVAACYGIATGSLDTNQSLLVLLFIRYRR